MDHESEINIMQRSGSNFCIDWSTSKFLYDNQIMTFFDNDTI